MTTTTTARLNTGASIPLVGLGTWQAGKGEVGAAVKTAIRAGYRHFDCAEIYDNEAEIGEGLKSALDEGLVKREELFITSKVFNSHHHPERAIKALHNTLNNLQLSYLDLYLIHWPVKFEDEELPLPLLTDDHKINPAIKWSFSFKEIWKTLEQFQKEGLVKSIGVSNFTIKQLEDLLADSQTVPAVNQVELHPYLYQPDLLSYCAAKGIHVTAYTPLGRANEASGSLEPLIKTKAITSIAAEVNRTPAQVLLRWAVQKGASVIPKSTNEERMRSNLDVFNFHLSNDQIARIDGLHCNHRYFDMFPGQFNA